MSTESKTELAKYYAKLALVAVNAGATKIAQVTDALIASGVTKADAENAAAAALAAKGVANGGCSCKLGGYGDDYSSPTRDAFVKEMLKFAESEGVKLSGSTNEERLKSYLDSLTNYSAPGAEARCRKLAEKVNGFYGDVIDTKAPVKEICEQIAEVMAAFRSGMHAEFLGVYSDVRSVLHNMMVLDKWLDERISELSSDVSGSNAPPKAANNMELIKMLSAEIKRHIFMLNGLMKSGLEQTAGLLDTATAKPGVLMQHIKRLESSGGDTKNLRTIELNLRRGVAVNAYMAEHIKQALAKVGMSVAEFKAADTIQKLKEAILKGILGKGTDSLDKDLPSATAAAEEIIDRFVDREKLLEIMGAGPRHGGAEFSDDFGEYDKNGYPRSDIERRQDSQKRLRKLVLTVFNRAVNERFNMVVDALNRLAARVGKEIPPGDSLKEFTDTLGRIKNDLTHKKYLYHALIGYYNDAMSKSVKDQFVANMNMVSRAVDGLLALPEYAAGAQYLRDVKDAISGVISVIDKYSDEVSQKFGAAEVSGGYHMSPSSVQGIPLFSTLFLGAAENRGSDDDEVVNVGGGAYDAIADTYGGAEGGCCGATGGAYDSMADTYGGKAGGAYDASDIYGGAADDKDLHDKYAQYRPPKGVGDAITAFTFLTRAETIKKNLAAMAGDTASYGKDQTDRNAQSIVEILSKSQKEYIAMRDYLKTQQPLLAGVAGITADAAEKLVGQAQSFLDDQWNARKNFWATVESMDECMRQFTDTIVASPDKVKEIDQLLDSVEIISDWYSSKAGNTLAEIFEKFPDALPPLGGATALGPYAGVQIATSTDHYYKIIEAGGHQNVGNPYIKTTMDAAKEVSESLKKFFMLMTALKNLFSVFVHFGHAVGGDALSKSAMMPPNRMYQNIVMYLRASSLSQGHIPPNTGLLAADEKSLRPTFIGGQSMDTIKSGNLNGTDYGSHQGGAGNAMDAFRRMYGISMRSVNEDIKATDAVKFDLEDKYFVHMIKAAAAKVLTVTGTYGLFSRPASYVDQQQRLAPIRMILGGGSDLPEVIPEATGLYLRLPLLLQWYRRLFDGDDPNRFGQYNDIPLAKGNRSLKVSLIPDIDGTFAPLIKLIFTDLRAVDTAAYTDEDLRRIVREVNNVWQRSSSKHQGNPVRGIIHDLVNEVNRRYGIVNKDDYDKAREEGERGYRYREISNDYGKDEFDTDLAILPGEDGDLPSRLTPSQRLMNSDVELSKTIRKSKYTVTADHYKIVRDFRCAIDKLLEGDGNAYQFSDTIATVQNELKTVAGSDKRFEIVATLMRGTDLRARVDGFKYVLFNETVVASLNLLSGIHTILKHYQARMLVCNYSKIVDYVAKLHVAGGPPVADTDALCASVLAAFTADYPWLGTDDKPQIALYRAFGGTSGGPPGTGGHVAGQYVTTAAAGGDPYVYLSTLLAGMTDADKIAKLAKAKSAPSGQSDAWQKVQAFFSGLLNRKNMMLEIIDAVYSVCDGAHATASMSDGRMTVAYGGLEEMVRDTFASTFYFMNLLQPKIEQSLYSQWTDKLKNGSYYWLQEQLMEKIIIGRRKGSASIANSHEYPNLEVISRGIADTWMWIVGSHHDATMAAPAAAAVSGLAKDQFGNMFAAAIFYDANAPQSGIQASNVAAAAADAQLLSYRVDPYEELVVSGPSDKRVLDTRFIARFKQLYTWGKEFTKNRSLLFDFNQLVAKYIQSFYDVNSKKIFTGLIDKLANSAFASAVSDPVNYTYSDVVPAVQIKFGAQSKREMPQSVVLASGLNAGWIDAFDVLLTAVLQARPNDYIANAGSAIPAGHPSIDAAWGGAVPQLLIDMVVQSGGAIDALGQLGGGAAVGALIAIWNNCFQGRPDRMNAIIQQFPFAKDIGPAGSPERAERIRLLAVMTVWSSTVLPAVMLPAFGKDLAAAMKTSTYAVPIDARGSAHKWLVSAEDMATMDDSNPTATSVNNGGSTDKSVLLYARTANIRGYPNGSTYAGLGGKAAINAPVNLAAALQFGQRKDPDADHVLFTSLAVTLRTLVSTKTTGTSAVNVYLTDTVADLPQHMKEKYRANLPAFKTLLGALVQRCEFYKMLISRGGVDLGRNALAATVNVWPFTLMDPLTDSQKNMTRFGGIIDAITRGCTAMIQSIDQTLREVGDDPMYLEIAQGSIRDYTAQNGIAPFMPLSSTLVALKNVGIELFPVHQTGDSEFKLMYGTRGMLHGLKPTQENTPGFAKIVQLYNGGVGTQYMADVAAAQQFLERYVRSLRWIYGVRNIRGMLTHQPTLTLSRYDVVRTTMPVAMGGLPTNNTDYQSIIDHVNWDNKPVWSIAKSVDDTIRLTESSMFKERVDEFIDYIYQRQQPTPPDLAIQNILDLDIVPINVHALRREIPFADLLNYSYTFDRMIIELYYGHVNATSDEKNVVKLIRELCSDMDTSSIRSAKDMLVSLLISPHQDFGKDITVYSRLLRHLEGMLRGTVTIDGLSRPRFLSDEVFGKAIFGEIYCEPGYYNEMGPGAGHVASTKYRRDTVVTSIATEVMNLFRADCTGAGGALPMCANLAVAAVDANLQKLVNAAVRFSYDNAGAAPVDDIVKVMDKYLGAINSPVQAAGRAPTPDEKKLLAKAVSILSYECLNYYEDKDNHVALGRAKSTLSQRIGNRLTPGPIVLAAGAAVEGALDGLAPPAGDPRDNVRGIAAPGMVQHTPNLHYLAEGDDLPADLSGATHQPDNQNVLDSRQVKSVEVHANLAGQLAKVGAQRFDTVLVRNLVFIINMLRSVRLQLTRDLFYGQGSVVSSNANIAPRITEMYGNAVNTRK